MSIDVYAKNVKLWKNEHDGRKGTWYTYSISVSKKNRDGSYKNKGMKVYPKDGLPADLPNGAMCDIEGFMTLDVWDGRDGEVVNPMIFATNIKFHDYESQGLSSEDLGDSYEQLDEDMPF